MPYEYSVFLEASEVIEVMDGLGFMIYLIDIVLEDLIPDIIP